MGKPDTVMHDYLTDKYHFADLFNGIFFQGMPVIRPCDLQEASERYSDPKGAGSNRFRDIKMFLKSGETFRVLAVENQDSIDYTMPYRCMQYDVMEYGKQLRERKLHNKEHKLLTTTGEQLCGIAKSDRLAPVYTLCLYHGKEPWDGPLSLKDMVDFRKDSDRMSRYFADYPLRLFCINSAESFEMFHTELKELFRALSCRKDKAKLLQLFERDDHYSHLTEDTIEALSVLLDIPVVWEKLRKAKRDENNEGGYAMCEAIWEMRAEDLATGRAQGLAEGKIQGLAEGKIQGKLENTKMIVQNMLKRGFSDGDICALAECTVEFIDSIR